MNQQPFAAGAENTHLNRNVLPRLPIAHSSIRNVPVQSRFRTNKNTIVPTRLPVHGCKGLTTPPKEDDSETMTLRQLTVETIIPVIRIFDHFRALPTSNFQPRSMKPAGILVGYHDNTDDETPRAKDTTNTAIDATLDPCEIWKKNPEITIERRNKINNAAEHK
ncbi:hypothetical protein Tco_0333300 [Tanacetum coccineum]